MTHFVRAVEKLLLVNLRQISQQSLVVSFPPPLTRVFSLLFEDLVEFLYVFILRSLLMPCLEHEIFDLFELTG